MRDRRRGPTLERMALRDDRHEPEPEQTRRVPIEEWFWDLPFDHAEFMNRIPVYDDDLPPEERTQPRTAPESPEEATDRN